MKRSEDFVAGLFEKRHEYDRKARGEIIYAAVVIEGLIEQILINHFCRKGQEWLFRSMLFGDGQITFSLKLRILRKLFKAHYPDLVFPRMFAKLDDIREIRNKLAHSKVGHSVPVDMQFEKEEIETLPEGTVLEYLKDGYMVHQTLSKEYVETHLETAAAYEALLKVIEAEVFNRVHGVQNDYVEEFAQLKTDFPHLFEK